MSKKVAETSRRATERAAQKKKRALPDTRVPFKLAPCAKPVAESETDALSHAITEVKEALGLPSNADLDEVIHEAAVVAEGRRKLRDTVLAAAHAMGMPKPERSFTEPKAFLDEVDKLRDIGPRNHVASPFERLQRITEALAAQSCSNAAVFVECFLEVVNEELDTIYYALHAKHRNGSSCVDPDGLARTVFNLTRRVAFASEVFKELQALDDVKKGAAA